MKPFSFSPSSVRSAPTPRNFAWRGGAAARFLAGVGVAGVALNAGAIAASASGASVDALTFNTARTATFRSLTGLTPRAAQAKHSGLGLRGVNGVFSQGLPAVPAVAYTLTSGNFSTISPTITGDTSAANGDSLTIGGTTYTSQDNLAFNLNFNVLTFTNSSIVNVTRGTGTLITLASTTGGTTPVVNLNGTGLPTLYIDLALANNTLFTGTKNLAILGAVSGAGNLTDSTTGTLTLNGNNSGLTGNTLVTTGTLVYTGTSDAGSGTVSVTGGTLQLGSSGALTSANAVTLGTATSLVISSAAASYAAFPIAVTGNAGLTFSGADVATYNIASPITLSNSATFTVGETKASDTVNLQGLISGTGNLAIAPAGGNGNPLTVTINKAETYSGSTAITQTNVGGTKDFPYLKLLSGGSLPSTTVLTISDANTGRNTTFDLNGQNQTLAGLVSAGASQGNDAVLNSSGTASALTLNDTANSSFGGVIGTGTTAVPTNANLSLIKSGLGTQTLSGTNTYIGATTVSAGTLQENAGASLSGSGVTVASGATLALNGYATYNNVPITITGTGASGQRGALTFNNGNAGTYTLPNAITLGGNSTIGQFGVSDTINFNGAIGGTGNLTISPEGGSSASHTATFNFGAAGTYTGSTTFASGAGQLSDTYNLNVANALPSGTALVLNPSVGTIFVNLAGNNETLSSLSGNPTTAKQVVEGTGGTTATLTINNSSTDTYAGALGAGGANNLALSKTGVGTLILGGTNTYTGGTTIAGGAIQINPGDTNALGTNGTLTINTSGVLDLNGANIAVDSLSGTATGTAVTNSVSGNTSTLTVGSNNGSGTFGGNIINNTGGTGIVALTKSGTGTQTLSGANTYTGATSVNAGTLAVNGSTASGSAVAVSSGATLTGSGTVGGSVADSGTINPGSVGGAASILSSGAVTFASGSIFGLDYGNNAVDELMSSGAITTLANATINFNSIGGAALTNSTYTLLTGTSGFGGTLPTSTTVPTGYHLGFVNNTLDLLVNTTAATYTLTATAAASNVRVGSGAIGVTSTLANTGTGSADSLNYSGLGSSNTSGGTTSGGPVTQGNSASNSGQTFTPSTVGSYTLTPSASVTNATLGGSVSPSSTTPASVNVYSGQTSYVGTGGNYLTGGSNAVQQTQWADGGAPGVDGAPYTGTDTASFASNGTVSVNAAVNLKALALGGGTTLATDGVGGHGFTLQSGSGMANLTATGTGNAISAPVTLATSTTATVTSSGDTLTVSGNISGTGSLTKAGAGTLTLTGTDSATGTTTVSAGTLALANTGGGAITGTGDNITVSGSGTFVTVGDASNGVLSLGAANQLQGATTRATTTGQGGTDVTLTGGTLELNGTNQGSTSNSGSPRMGGNGGVTESSFGAGLLTVTGGNSYLDFGAGNTGAVFTFSGYDLSSTGTLYIENYNDGNFTGTYAAASGGGIDQLFFGNGQYSVQELMHVYFVNPIGAGGGVKTGIWEAKLLSTGEVVAPEPSAWASLLVGTLGLAGLAMKARRRKAVDAAAA